jgi:hypothetical protein
MTNQAETSIRRSVGFLIGMSMLMLGANLVWTAYNSLLLPTLVEGGHKEWERLGNRSDRLLWYGAGDYCQPPVRHPE